jgi:hypothetical protein
MASKILWWPASYFAQYAGSARVQFHLTDWMCISARSSRPGEHKVALRSRNGLVDEAQHAYATDHILS